MDTGLSCLVAIARFHQLPAEPDQLAHQFAKPSEIFSDTELLLAAKSLTLKAKHLTLSLTDLKNALLPAIAKAKDGSYFIVAKISSDELSTENTKQHHLLNLAFREMFSEKKFVPC